MIDMMIYMMIDNVWIKTTAFFILFVAASLPAQNATTPGAVETYQTLHSIGIEWSISGDDNHNADCTVQYRRQGESTWKSALPLFRIDISGFGNMLAGSILFLEAGTSYDIELSLSDSDGGSSTQTLTLTTRVEPQLPSGGNAYYVSPGSGGGSGSQADPFLGIDAAQAVAQPGDIFLLDSGTYGSSRVRFTASGTNSNYIFWKAAPGESPVLPGARIIGDFIWLEGVTIEHVDYGLLTEYGYEPEGIVIRNNRFEDCYYSIQLNHGGKNWIITDNTIIGRISDYSSGAMDGEGIELEHTHGHVVAYNSISNTADAISYPGRNCDIYNNEIFHVSDDGIELDFTLANTRTWNNRITNAYNNGISFQNTAGESYGAPWYVLRNQVIVAEEDVIKLRDNVDRALVAHNTFVSWEGAVANSTGKLIALQSNNNLWISVIDRYVWEDNSSSTTPDWRTDLDYNGFDWNDNIYALKWAATRYTTLQAFQSATGLELNGIRVKKDSIFQQFDVPEPPNLAPFQVMTLKNGCNAVDAGKVLANINDDYSGSAPDLGAFECNSAVPHYGPRSSPRIRATLLLQGPAYESGGSRQMPAGLPLNQSVSRTPYYDLGWDSQAVTASPVPAFAADWVFVQLRTAPEQLPLFETSAFVAANGVLLDIDGSEGITADVDSGDYYLTVKQRNHLSVTSSGPVSVSTGDDSWDFTGSRSQALAGKGLVPLAADTWALAAGELDHDGFITSSDYVVYYNQQDSSGYTAADLDFDGDVDATDYLLWLENARRDVR